ncbi:MAG: PadR family transcriptional regulator [Oleiphilaceae bacterium]|nr:PadR family transcriptional regulator [Oleiphilaceae bacterium]
MSLKHAILVLLETEPSSGYDLIKHFKRSLGYFWNARHQQVYQQLKQLHEDNLIDCHLEQQDGKPDKKIYAINQKGIDALKDWLSAPVKPNKINDALLVKLYGGHLTSDQNLLEELERHIDINQRTLNELLEIEQTYLALPTEQKERYKLPYLTLRRGILSEQAWLEWAEEAKQTITK